MTEIPTWLLVVGIVACIGFFWQTVAAIYWSLTAKQAQQDAEMWEQAATKLLTQTQAFQESVARGALEKIGHPLPTPSATEAIQVMEAALSRVAQLYTGGSGVESQMYVVARSALDQVGVALYYARPRPPQTTVESAGPSKAPIEPTSGSSRTSNGP